MKDKTRYLKWGITLFLTVCAIMVFYDTFYQSGALQRFVAKMMGILAPVVYGFAIAYLLTPIVNWLEKGIRRGWNANKKLQGKKLKHASTVLRAASILITEALALYAIYLLMSVLVPQLVESISMLINNAETYYNTVYDWANNILNQENSIFAWIGKLVTDNYDGAMSFLRDKILPWGQKMLSGLTDGIWSGIWGVVTFAKNLIIGFIISVYMLAMKEKSLARCCKLVYGIFKENQAAWIIRGVRRINSIFSGFVRGKMLASLIVGVVCFIGCYIMKIPYTPLISVVVGVTNVIPFFGPFIGAIPSALLILLVNPWKCVIFLIFILILKQVDGNIIGPKILGESIGINGFWVIFSIILFGGLFGFWGMLLGVPVFVIIYTVIEMIIDKKLRKKGLPSDAAEYMHLDYIDPESGEMVMLDSQEEN